jgi:hypothetical protein
MLKRARKGNSHFNLPSIVVARPQTKVTDHFASASQGDSDLKPIVDGKRIRSVLPREKCTRVVNR